MVPAAFFASCLDLALRFWNQFCGIVRRASEDSDAHNTYVDLVEGDPQRLGEAFLCLCIRLVLSLVMRFENVVLLLGQTRLDVYSEAGQMMREMMMLGMVSIHVRVAEVVMIAILHRISTEVWMTQIDVMIVVCICGRVRVELHTGVCAVAAAASASSFVVTAAAAASSSSCPFEYYCNREDAQSECGCLVTMQKTQIKMCVYGRDYAGGSSRTVEEYAAVGKWLLERMTVAKLCHTRGFFAADKRRRPAVDRVRGI